MKKIILLLFSLMIIFIIGCNVKNKPIVCTQDAKLCPDGSSVGRIPPNCEFAECPATRENPTEGQGEENYCTPEQKKADICIELYQPVCGWFDPKKIQCIRYPCAQTFSNSCFACADEKVLYWTEGECPK